MNVKPGILFAGVLAVTTGLYACSSSNPTRPSMSFGAPLAQQPANGVIYNFNQQPLTLTITNSVRTGSDPVTYSLEVASDSGFSNKVFTRDSIAEGSGGTTSVQINMLTGNSNYYWRWRAVVSGIAGEASLTQGFFVRPNIVLNPPQAATPANGGVASGPRPIFTVTNSTRSGQPGPVTYKFQVSTSSAFSTLLASASVAEQGGATTSWTPSVDIPAGALFWRARARDLTNSVNSDFGGATSFTVQLFDFKQAVIWNNPPDLGSWAQTANITLIDVSSGRVVVDFDKRDGPDRWPDVGFGDGPLEYTLGMCINLSGKWNCSAAIQFWNGRDLSEGGDADGIARDWFYDARWGAMTGHQPAPGEVVGIFVAAGNLRDSGNVITKERSNVVFLPWGTTYSR